MFVQFPVKEAFEHELWAAEYSLQKTDLSLTNYPHQMNFNFFFKKNVNCIILHDNFLLQRQRCAYFGKSSPTIFNGENNAFPKRSSYDQLTQFGGGGGEC